MTQACCVYAKHRSVSICIVRLVWHVQTALFRVTPNWKQCECITKLWVADQLKLQKLTLTKNCWRPQPEKNPANIMKSKVSKDAFYVGSFTQSSKTNWINSHRKIRAVVITFEETGGGGPRKETPCLWWLFCTCH